MQTACLSSSLDCLLWNGKVYDVWQSALDNFEKRAADNVGRPHVRSNPKTSNSEISNSAEVLIRRRRGVDST